jgi:hypothetical protein
LRAADHAFTIELPRGLLVVLQSLCLRFARDTGELI